MVINIGGLWDTPIPIADDTPLLSSAYSDIDCNESERTAFGSYNREAYHSNGIYDATDYIYFKNLSGEECGQGVYASKASEEICPIERPESCSAKAADQETFSKGGPSSTSTSSGSKIEKSGDVRVGGGSSGQNICRHASKALRVRSSATKDRHSKVNTAKGLRDRRVRLSVSTAVQFYDVQYRLGLDQPSKALDWLMSKAQAAIDELSGPPSYITNLDCLMCNSTSKSTPTDVILTSEANKNLEPKARCSERSVHPADLTQRYDSEDTCALNGGKEANTARSTPEHKDSGSGRKVTTQSGSQADKLPLLVSTPSNHQLGSPPQNGRLSKHMALTMLDCCTQQCLAPCYSQRSLDLKMPRISGQLQYPNAYNTPPPLPPPQQPSYAKALMIEHQQIPSRNRAGAALVVYSSSFDLTHANGKGIKPSENCLSAVASTSKDVHEAAKLHSTDFSVFSLSRPPAIECLKSHSARRIQEWCFPHSK